MDELLVHNGTIQRLLTPFSDLNVVYRVVIATLLAGIIYQVTFKRRKHGLLDKFPVWATIELAVTALVVGRKGLAHRIYSSVRRYGGSLFGLTSRHQVLINLPGLDRLFAQPHHAFTTLRVQYTLMTRVFGSPDSPELRALVETSYRDLSGPIERAFLNEANVAASLEIVGIPQRATSFVSFASDTKLMKRWELSAGINVITPATPHTAGAVEANLQALTRDFGACISIPILYGQDFLDRYPQLLDDLWRFDNDLFPLLMIGVPTWAPFRVVRDGLAARARLAGEIAALYRRIDESARSGADMSGFGTASRERNEIYTRDGWGFEHRGWVDLPILWGQNANTHPMLFWLLTYVYSTPGLLDALRKEVAPYVGLSEGDDGGLEITALDILAISRRCPRLKAAIFETYRMANEPASIRYVEQHIIVTDGSQKHVLAPGTWVSAPHGVVQRDASVYADPDTFDPERFLGTDRETGEVVARYGRMRPWGAGTGMCKGRTFAEKENLVEAAAIISLWEIEPANGEWVLPGMVPGTGVKKPVQDIRVVIRRRTLG